ncbi:MAG: DUF302 domain-containing protein [Luteitalea sp.]|nr:DUF302 domain-containing protein [Luteitalea sp.]
MTFRRLPFVVLLPAAVLCAFFVGRQSSSVPLAAAAGLPDLGRAHFSGWHAGRGLVVVPSEFTPEETAERLELAATEGGANVVADIDHAAAAAGAGLELRPTRVLLIGNPNAGTPLMVASQITGIDLPLKFVIYEDAQGRVLLAYNSAWYLRRRHRIRGEDELLRMIEANQRALAAAATQS